MVRLRDQRRDGAHAARPQSGWLHCDSHQHQERVAEHARHDAVGVSYRADRRPWTAHLLRRPARSPAPDRTWNLARLSCAGAVRGVRAFRTVASSNGHQALKDISL